MPQVLNFFRVSEETARLAPKEENGDAGNDSSSDC
jgi:hypothetical protein